ncbi:MAG: hypothetical protein OEY95_03615 [Candidatus Bathyarchaeota archaeon]|nr:hypothetical protein [Candidatus Bathyarchaeota archaeon]
MSLVEKQERNNEENLSFSLSSVQRVHLYNSGTVVAEADEELKLKPSERGRPERCVKAFFKWLQTEHVRKKSPS